MSDNIDLVIEKVYDSRYPAQKPKIRDFDEIKDAIRRRARLFAKELRDELSDVGWYEMIYPGIAISGYAYIGANREATFFPVNKPAAQKLLFMKTMVDNIVEIAWIKNLIDKDRKFTQEVLDYFDRTNQALDWEGRVPTLSPPDFPDLEAEVKKEASLFPDAEPVQVEAPGNIILSLTTDEAAVIVYLDEEHKGKEVALESEELWRINSRKPVLEIKRGKESYFVAIFNHIPLVTAEDKSMGTWRKNFPCRVKFFNLEEEHYLFKGQVTVQDWRGWEVRNVR